MNVSREDYDRVISDLRGHVASLSEGSVAPSDVFDDVDICDAGYVDSVRVTEFRIRITTQYDISLPDWKIGTELKSLREIALHILSERKDRADSPEERTG
jgi:acyl carrier protein